MTLTGNASAVDYQTAIQSVRFSTTSTDITPRSIDVQVFDGAFASGIANTAITFRTVLNEPTAVRDVYVGDEDSSLSIPSATGLLANDSDPQPADTLTVVSALDGDNVAIPVNAVGASSPVTHTMPSGAVVTLYEDGSFDYVPIADYSGVEFFDYTVSDDDGNLSTSYASINIQGVADTPNVPVGLASSGANEDTQSNTIDITSTQSDADGSEELRYSISQVPVGYTITDGDKVFLFNNLTDIAYLDDWDVTNISIIPPSPDQHSDVDVVALLTVEASESNSSTNSVSENITFVFDAVADVPTVVTTTGNAGPGALIYVDPLITAQSADTDGSETISEYQFSNIPAGVTFFVGGVAQTPDGFGVVTVAAADFLSLQIQAPVALGTYNVDLVAVSSETNAENGVAVLSATSATEVLSFNVNNVDDPVTANDDTFFGAPNQSTVLTVLANDDIPDGGPQILQVDGQAISVGGTITLGSGAGTVTLNANGTLTFTGAPTLTGQETFTYQVQDVDGSTDTATITIEAPIWSITGDASVAEGAAASYTISLDAVPSIGTSYSVDISAINIDTTTLDYDNLAAAVQAAADGSTNFSFDGTTLTFTQDEIYSAATFAGSNFVDISSTGTALGLATFGESLVNLGFNFDFYGTNYTNVYVNDFGVLTFGAASPNTGEAYQNEDFSTGNTLNGLPVIAPFWDVLGADRTNSDDIYTQVVGTVGNRELIVQYNDIVIYFDDTPGETITFQAVLKEGSNEIEFRYDDVTLSNGTYSNGSQATIGISDGSGTEFSQISFNSGVLADNTRIVFNTTPVLDLTFTLDALNDTTFEGSEDFQITLSNASNSSVNATLDDVTTSITDTNVGPTITAPVTGGTAITETTVNEDSVLVFNSTNGNEITVDDVDSPNMTVTVSATNGVINAASGSSATVTDNGTSSVTITGTAAQINDALNGLFFDSDPDYNGTALLTISTDDNEGQPNSVTTTTVDILVNPVVDAFDDIKAVATGNTAIIDILANDTFTGTITNITATNGANGTVTVNPDNTITYTASGASFVANDTFTYSVTSAGITETATVLVVLSPAPMPLDDTGNTNEDAILSVDAASGVLNNDVAAPPAATLDYDTVDLSGAPAGSWAGGLASHDLTWSGGITLDSTPSTGFPGITQSLVFDGTEGAVGSNLQSIAGDPTNSDASFEVWFKYDPADYTSGQGAILYENGGAVDGMSISLSDSAGAGTGTIDHLRVQFNDGGNTINILADLNAVIGAMNIPDEFIQVTAVYDRNATGPSDEVRVYVNGIIVATQQLNGIDDWGDGGDAGLGTTANTANVGNTDFGLFEGEIAGFNFYESALSDTDVKNSFDTVAGLTVDSHDTTSALGATVVVNADGSYSYDPSSAAALQALQAGDTVNDTFTYTVIDGNGVTETATVTVTVLGVNDAPDGTDITVTLNEDQTHTITVANFGFDDPIDGTNDNFDSVIITTVPADGDLIYDDGVAAPSTVTAGQIISAADIASGFLQFVPDANTNNTTTAGPDYSSFTFQVVDDGGTALTGEDTDQVANTFTFNVTPVQDPVSNTVPGAQSTTEDTVLNIAGVSVTEIDGDTLTTTVSIPAANGTLNVATGGSATVSANGTSTVTITGTAAEVSAALAGLSYTPTSDFNTDVAGAFDLTLTTTDGPSTDVSTISIAVSAVADITDDTIATTEDNAASFNVLTGTNGATADTFENGSAAVTSHWYGYQRSTKWFSHI